MAEHKNTSCPASIKKKGNKSVEQVLCIKHLMNHGYNTFEDTEKEFNIMEAKL